MNFSERMQKVKSESFFSLTKQGFNVWCGSITKVDDKYYLYFSFWPCNKGHKAWLTHSKIGFAVSDSPTGPYKYAGIALSGAGGDAWDRDCVHNPVMLEVEGTYYLYYMGNTGDGEYWNHRNSQRVGVAWSKSPEGPFERFDEPLLDVRPDFHDSLLTSNPSVCKGPDGKIYMVYKAVEKVEGGSTGGNVVCGMAVAEHPLGKFVRTDKPIFTNPDNPWSVEDPFIWYENDRFYVIAKDFQGYFTKSSPFSVALFESKDGFDWEVSETPLAFETILHMENGEDMKLRRMERPQMWTDENGHPKVLCCACTRMDDPDDEDTFNVQIAIK